MISERFGTTNITVTVEWTPARDDVWYNISSEPHVDVIFTRNTSIQLIALYSTLYNVTVVASSALCNIGISRVGFNYSKCVLLPIFLILLKLLCTASCGYPVSDSIDQALRVIGYKAPMLEGSSIKLDCFPGYAFIGPSNSSTCMGNGEWQPDPREVECEGITQQNILYIYIYGRKLIHGQW